MNTTRLMDAVENTLQKMKAAGIGFGESHLRAALEEAKEAPMIIVIHVEDAPHLVDVNGKEFPNVLVIDWMMLEAGGDCPVCGREQTPGTPCDHCGLDVWNKTNLQKRARTAALQLWRKGQKGPR